MKKIVDILTWAIFGVTIFLIAFFVVPVLPLPFNTYKVVIVRSGSMEPTIHTGSIVVYRKAGHYGKDDIVAFREDSAGANTTKIAILHRIVKVDQKDNQPVFTTKGDANKTDDGNAVPEANVYGKYVFSIPFVGYLVAWGQTPTGFVVMVVLPIALLLYHELQNFLNKMKEKKKNKKQAAAMATAPSSVQE